MDKKSDVQIIFKGNSTRPYNTPKTNGNTFGLNDLFSGASVLFPKAIQS